MDSGSKSAFTQNLDHTRENRKILPSIFFDGSVSFGSPPWLPRNHLVTIRNNTNPPMHTMAEQPATPKIHWRKLLAKVITFAATETILNLGGVSTIADYAEFLADNNAITIATETLNNLITLV